MDFISRFIANRIAPEAVKPFWSEVVVCSLVLLTWLVLISVLHLTGWLVPLDDIEVLGIHYIAYIVITAAARFLVRRAFELPLNPIFWIASPGDVAVCAYRPEQSVPEWMRRGRNYAWVCYANILPFSGLLAVGLAYSAWLAALPEPDWNRIAESAAMALLIFFLHYFKVLTTTGPSALGPGEGKPSVFKLMRKWVAERAKRRDWRERSDANRRH